MPATVTINLPDGATIELPEESTYADLAAALGRSLAKSALAAETDGRLVDLASRVDPGSTVRILTADSAPGREVLRHSTAHVLAQAVRRLWPGAHYAIGPVIADGFYYDFELPDNARFTDDDLERIEAEMRRIVKENQPFERHEHSIEEGLELFGDQPFKREIIETVGHGGAEVDAEPGSRVTSYRNTDEFTDLCRGPHVPNTGRLGHFKLLRVAGAYWRGDEHRPQLQRIYGTAFESAAALAEHLHRLEEAERRDHRRVGQELDLFSFPEEIGSGLAVFHPKGGLIRKLIEDYSRARHLEGGYSFVTSPHISKRELFDISGHLEWFADSMYPPMTLDEGQEYFLKPMNCPFHVLIYRSRQRSYRDLPMRLFEFGAVYRYERSGVVHGLTRVRGMTQDDAHLFVSRDQVAEELARALQFVLDMLRAFGLRDFYLELSTRPEAKAVGSIAEWDEAEAMLRAVGNDAGLELVDDPGGGAFYGPKISVQARDAIGRTHQLSTVQLDFQLPPRFDATYVGADNQRHRPVMIHRALFGSVERFLAILLEHYAGALPTWLMPEQFRVLPVRDDHAGYARSVATALTARGLRGESEDATEPLGARIRRAKLEKLPYILVVGDDDVASGTVGVNRRGSEHPERAVALAALVGELVKQGRVARVTGGSCELMALERMDAGWRRRYVEQASAGALADGECVFCALSDGPVDASTGVVELTEECFVVLNAFPYGSGHILVLPRRHVARLDELTESESSELWLATTRALRAIEVAYGPDGANLGANLGRAGGAGIPGHVHLHALPRWDGDTNFMTSVAETRVLPESLEESFAKLHAAYGRLARGA